MGAWRFAAPGGLYLFASLAACGGSEFSSDGNQKDASVDVSAGGGMSGAGGATGGTTGGGAGLPATGGYAGVAGTTPINDCTNELFGLSCDQITTGDSTCDDCGRMHCCTEATNCAANTYCAQTLACYFKRCKGGDASGSQCVIVNCSQCALAGATLFTGLSSCLLNNCASACPDIKG